MATRYEWTTTIPYSPFYHREYDWFGQAQVHSCALCNEELHRAPDGVAGESSLDLLAKKFIHHHFIGVRHENNLKEVIDVARSACNTTAASAQGKIPSLFKPTGITCTCIASTQTQTNGITRRKLRSNRRPHNKTPACKVCDSLLHAAVAATTLEISAARDLPNDIGMSILLFVGIQEKTATASASNRSTETRRAASQPK